MSQSFIRAGFLPLPRATNSKEMQPCLGSRRMNHKEREGPEGVGEESLEPGHTLLPPPGRLLPSPSPPPLPAPSLILQVSAQQYFLREEFSDRLPLCPSSYISPAGDPLPHPHGPYSFFRTLSPLVMRGLSLSSVA